MSSLCHSQKGPPSHTPHALVLAMGPLDSGWVSSPSNSVQVLQFPQGPASSWMELAGGCGWPAVHTHWQSQRPWHQPWGYGGRSAGGLEPLPPLATSPNHQDRRLQRGQQDRGKAGGGRGQSPGLDLMRPSRSCSGQHSRPERQQTA